MSEVKESIARKVADHLYWDSRVDTSDIRVDASDGNIKLTGTVPDYLMLQIAEDDVWSVQGVKSLDDQLTVKKRPGIEVPKDDKIKSNVEKILSYNPDIDSSKINVSVENGTVFLVGCVDAYWKKMIVEDLVYNVSHVIDSINKLTVVPSRDIVDKTIADDIINAMSRSKWIDVQKIHIKVEKGVVTLSGTVPNRAGYFGALNAAQYTDGVIDVVNNLKYE
jgi:osmotically-inducible protein OsmY